MSDRPSETLRWFTASAVAGIDAQGELRIDASPYLGVDAQGRIAARQPNRPPGARIIHDLGQALLMPLGTRRLPLALRERPSDSQIWLAQQRQEGIGAIVLPALEPFAELSAQAHTLGLRVLKEKHPPSQIPEGPAWHQSFALTRCVEPNSGTLAPGARFDTTLLDLDHPHLSGLSSQEILESVRNSPSYPAVRELWIGGWRVML